MECDTNTVFPTLHSYAVLENNYSLAIEEEAYDINIKDEPKIIRQWKQFPYSYFKNSTMLSRNCKKGVTRFLTGLKHNQIWALKMYDATAKLPPGILSGNVNQFGDYDECLSLQLSQYCLAEVKLDLIQDELYQSTKNLIHSYFPFRGTFDDPQHRIPDFSSIRWGICIPSECTSQELQQFLQTNLNAKVRVQERMCKKSHTTTSLSFGHYFARFFFMALLLAIIISSVLTQFNREAQSYRETKWLKLLFCFSLQNNWEQLTTLGKRSQKNLEKNNNERANKVNEEIRSIHGIRALSAIALLICHKSVALMYNPYINRTPAMEKLGQAWTVIGRTAIVYTDSFMLISGLLTTTSLLKDIETSGSIKFSEKLINRVFRLLPNVATLILFCTYILPSLNSGPLWPLVVEHHAALCKKHMWRNLFFIHNYFGFENMCLTHTHQVGIDMQLFMLTYLFFLMRPSKKLTFLIIGTLWILSTILRYEVTLKHNLSHMIYFGNPIHQMFDTANFSYILPTHRATIYVTGIFLAYALKHKIDLGKRHVRLLWIIATVCGALALLGPFHMAQKGYVYNNKEAALFGSLSPILWGVALYWTVVASNNGYAGWLGDLLSWNGFKYFTKIAYSFYLVQFPVFFYNVGVQRTSSQYSPLELFHFSETSVILALSVVLTICVELPFQRVEKVLFTSNRR
ncbi:hypothetical protein RN001_006482 [Aquatica leii]|uniref:Nose resistant-to-fluoxetine protein N-terminal domain-containing protein n=1 Tax=Aquatica leii TaxID=1421715 RepID=A0AAN7PE50_9COLE|nr:hypothetical protein RN001_006482 [Aquatica leii]